MANLKLSDSVEKIVRLDRDPKGNPVAVKIYTGDDETSRRTTKRLKPLERLVNQFVEAQAVAIDEYRARHKRSADKKKNGWFKDLGSNLTKSTKKGRKEVKFKKIF
jgi:hypothetical protein